MKWYKLKLIAKQDIALSTPIFRFALPSGGFKFVPGQYIGVRVKKLVKPDPLGPLKSFSISSSPADPFLEIVMRMRDTGFKQSLDAAKVGSLVDIEGPYGNFTLPASENRPIVFIVGGVGIAPARSMIKDTLENGYGYQMKLIFSNRSVATAPYLDELQQWASKAKNFELLDYFSHDGRIDVPAIKGALTGLKAPLFYIAGLPDMVHDVSAMLIKLGYRSDDIKTEDFAGY